MVGSFSTRRRGTIARPQATGAAVPLHRPASVVRQTGSARRRRACGAEAQYAFARLHHALVDARSLDSRSGWRRWCGGRYCIRLAGHIAAGRQRRLLGRVRPKAPSVPCFDSRRFAHSGRAETDVPERPNVQAGQAIASGRAVALYAHRNHGGLFRASIHASHPNR